jgi:hypothetical protein
MLFSKVLLLYRMRNLGNSSKFRSVICDHVYMRTSETACLAMYWNPYSRLNKSSHRKFCCMPCHRGENSPLVPKLFLRKKKTIYLFNRDLYQVGIWTFTSIKLILNFFRKINLNPSILITSFKSLSFWIKTNSVFEFLKEKKKRENKLILELSCTSVSSLVFILVIKDN